MVNKEAVKEAISETQARIIYKARYSKNYSFDEHLKDIDLIADLTELKIGICKQTK